MGVLTPPVLGDELRARRLQALLDDASDGRDARTFAAVRQMVVARCGDEEIKRTLLESVLGSKARESGAPEQYLDHKIRSARRMVEAASPRNWDPRLYWAAVRTSGLPSGHVRVLDHLLRPGWHGGVVSRSTALIGIDSALPESTAADVLHDLVEQGWLEVVREFNPKAMTPRVYRLHMGGRHDPGAVSAADLPPAPSSLDELCPRYLSPLTGHDAFRAAKGDAFRAAKGKGSNRRTLHAAYSVLRLLDAQPRPTRMLADILQCDPRTAQRAVHDLRKAGLVETGPEGHRLTEQPIHRLLEEAAIRFGTLGQRDAAHRAYRKGCQEHARRRAEAAEEARTPGTSLWRKYAMRKALAALARPPWPELLAEWGMAAEDLAQSMVEPDLASEATPLDLAGWAS